MLLHSHGGTSRLGNNDLRHAPPILPGALRLAQVGQALLHDLQGDANTSRLLHILSLNHIVEHAEKDDKANRVEQDHGQPNCLHQQKPAIKRSRNHQYKDHLQALRKKCSQKDRHIVITLSMLFVVIPNQCAKNALRNGRPCTRRRSEAADINQVAVQSRNQCGSNANHRPPDHSASQHPDYPGI